MFTRMRNLIIILVACLLFSCNLNKESDSSIKFSSISKDTVCHLNDKADSPEIKLHLDFDFPSESSNKAVLPSLQSLLIKSIVGVDSVMKDPNEAASLYFNKWIREYKSLDPEIVEGKDSLNDVAPDKRNFNWKVSLKGFVSYYENNILCYLVETNTLTNGEKESKIIRSINVIVDKAQPLSLDDIFVEGYEDSLRPYIISQLKKDNKLSDADDIESAGFFNQEDIYVSHNYQLDKECVSFYYNPGEISANVIGNVVVKLPYSELSFALRENSPIQNLIK